MKTITQQELDAIITKHELWLERNPEGERAEFIEANLSGLDFSDKNLSCALFIRTNLRGADLCGADLNGANLCEADLRKAILDGADLDGANIDFSVLPLWCGSLQANFDEKQLRQIAYHLVRAGLQSTNVGEDIKEELAKLIDFANGFHRVNECGEIRRNNY